jgi:hypothetical protein
MGPTAFPIRKLRIYREMIFSRLKTTVWLHDRGVVKTRISAAHEAIAGRLREIEGESDHRGEREKMEHALHALQVLTTDTKAWE